MPFSKLHLRSVVLASVALCVAMGCEGEPEPDPIYSEDLGLEAIPAEVGSLAGTFAIKALSATIVRIPVPGIDDALGGGVNYRINRRTWDAEAEVYRQQSELCGGFNFEVHGVVTRAAQGAYRAVPLSTEEIIEVDHARGTYKATGHVQLWGFDLEDQLNDPFPTTREEALAAPYVDNIYDMDDDEEIGITLFVAGLVEGEVYAIQRKTVDLEGILLGQDRMLGLAETGYESVTLGNNNPVLDQSSAGSAEPFPDPKESWFEEVRVADDITCEEVLEMEANGDLSRLRPF